MLNLFEKLLNLRNPSAAALSVHTEQSPAQAAVLYSAAAAAAAAAVADESKPQVGECITGWKILAEDQDIIDAARYAYTNYYSKPYTDYSFLKDMKIELYRRANGRLVYHNGTGETPPIVLHRNNHGLAYALRGVALIPIVAFLYSSSQTISQHERKLLQKESVIKQLQLAYIFTVACRQNELGFHNDSEKYEQFVTESARAFKCYALTELTELFTAEEVETFTNLILKFGNPANTDALSLIFRQVHRLDLARCFKSKDYYAKIYQSDEDEHSLIADLGMDASSLLVEFTLDLLRATGDRIRLYEVEGEGGYIDYALDTFYEVSTDPIKCLEVLDSVAIPERILDENIVPTRKRLVERDIQSEETDTDASKHEPAAHDAQDAQDAASEPSEAGASKQEVAAPIVQDVVKEESDTQESEESADDSCDEEQQLPAKRPRVGIPSA